MDGKKKNAFVTGATEPEGQRIVTALASQGINVVFTYEENLSMARALEERFMPSGVVVKGFPVNPENHEEIAMATVEGAALLRGFHCLVNNTAVSGSHSLILDIAPEEWESSLRRGLTACYGATKCILPYMMGQEGGVIINVWTPQDNSSRGVHDDTVRMGMEGFTLRLDQELEPLGVRSAAIIQCYPEEAPKGVLPGTGLPPQRPSSDKRIVPDTLESCVLFLLEESHALEERVIILPGEKAGSQHRNL